MRLSGGHMRNSEAQKSRITQVHFTVMSQEEIERWTIDQLNTSKLYDNDIPVEKGLNDLRLGINSNYVRCKTCKETRQCPGHFARIKLVEPVFHYGFLPSIVKILKCICLKCSQLKHPLLPDIDKVEAIIRSHNSKKRLNELSKLLQKVKYCKPADEDNDNKLKYCGCVLPKKIEITKDMKIRIQEEQLKDDFDKHYKQIINASTVYHILDKISQYTSKCLGFKQSHPKDLLIKTLLVCPPQVRPSIEMNPVKRCQDDITTVYTKIIDINNRLKDKDLTGNHVARAKQVDAMQRLIASIMDKNKSKKAQDSSEGLVLKIKQGSKTIKSFTQRLKGKQGRFRQHLMGKRVDFSARSVISPDSSLALDELGVPEKIASQLSFPQEITGLNFDRIVDLCMKKRVLYILKPTKDRKRFEPFNVSKFEDRKSIEKQLNYGMIAERCLQDGDYVIFNRQPTLHRMSMMCHRIRILPHSTFRLNLSVCTPYNADFDGDEMNMHVPQSYEVLSQIKHICHVPKQVVTPKNNAPVMGIVQDALLGIYLFTLRNTFLTREQVMSLIIHIDDFSGDLPLPAILKPQPLWTGKQVMSLLLPQKINISIRKDDKYQSNPRDNSILIHKGQILSGALNKEVVGSGSSGLIHILWLQISPQATANFMTCTQRIINHWLIDYGFTCGASDVVPTLSCKNKIKQEIHKTNALFYQNYNYFFDASDIENKNLHNKSKKIIDSLQFITNQYLNRKLRQMRNIVQQTISPFNNNIYKMIYAKSKGNQTNLTQILGMLGNQNVDGKRLPQGFYRRSMVHFSKDDYSPQPRGFIFSSFYGGLKAHEFFFHSMSGREGLSDTAVKTSRTGYIQRKLIKALEDVIAKYDGTIRDSQNNLIQRLYGEDGMSAQFIQLQKVPSLEYDNFKFDDIYRWPEPNLTQISQKPYEVLVFLEDFVRKKIESNYKETSQIFARQYRNLIRGRDRLREIFMQGHSIQNIYCPVKVQRIMTYVRQKYKKQEGKSSLNPVQAILLLQNALDEMVPPRYQKLFEGLKKERILINSLTIRQKAQLEEKLIKQQKQCGIQLFRINIRLYLSSKLLCSQRITMEMLRQIIQQVKIRYQEALVHAGETIGAIAAQSVGEPTTQMTLNTFHLAGVSQNNVTLGVPRIQELFDASRHMKTPSMKIFLKKSQTTKLNDMDILDIINKLPQKSISQFITSSKIYYNFNPGVQVADFDEKFDEIMQLQENQTPWIMVLSFKKVLSQIWLEITETITRLTKQYCHIKTAIYLDNKLEIILRVKSDGLQQFNKQKNKSKNMPTIYNMLLLLQLQIRMHNLANRVEGIKKVFRKNEPKLIVGKNGKIERTEFIVLQTQGSNLKQVLCLDFVDEKKTISNDIIQVSNVLGIEAARQTFINQFRMVLGFYNIYINSRHIITLCDWMTRKGRLTPINRNGINRMSEISVLRKASFQQTVEMMFDAAIFSEKDGLKGVSQRIIFGESCDIGTGFFDIVIDRSRVGDFFKKGQKDKNDYQEIEQLYQKQMICNTPFQKGTPNPYQNTPTLTMYSPGPTANTGAFTPFVNSIMTPKHGGLSPYNSPYLMSHLPSSTSPRVYMSPSSLSKNLYNSPYYQGANSPYSSSLNDPSSSRWTYSPNYNSQLSGHNSSSITPNRSVISESPSYSSRVQSPYTSRRQVQDQQDQ